LNLRKLQINGFKSFMSPLELDFSSGITAILGPNGCGKSNVVDAIRWVLGEQRTRILRNSKMENVLFNGTRLRKSLGMAEVYLHLENRDHSLQLDYDEVSIGRRLYRSGVSEYLVNGKPARLKDLRGLLIDTGLGNSMYSIIERDMVERVLAEKGQEKRHLLEEAAGVSRYRVQREEAERKIKATDGDLVRLVDILSELEKELRSLKYQMGKARRYQRLKEQADALETVLLKSTLHSLIGQKQSLLAEREEHENIRLADDNEISIRENRLQEVRIGTAEFERQLQGLNETRYELSTRLQSHEERIAVHNERITSSRARIVEDDEEIRSAGEKLAGMADDLTGQRETREEKQLALEALRDDLSSRDRALAELTRRLEEARGVLRNRKQLALDLVRKKAEEKGALEHIERSVGELADKQDTIESQLDELSDEETRRVEELSGIEVRAGEQYAKLTSLQNDLTRLTEALDRIAEERARVDTEYADAHRQHAKLTEKREFLERVKQEHTRWSDEALARYDALTGVLADFVRVDKKYRRCFEACLAPILKSVMATSREDAVAALGEFRGGDVGRVQILFADEFGGSSGTPQGPGIIGGAFELLDCDESVEHYLAAYLDGVVVVEDVETAAAVIAAGHASRVSTLDGVFFDGPGRIIVAGSDDIEMTILEYESKLDELARSLTEAAGREGRLSERRARLGEERESVQREIGEIRVSLADESQRYEGLQASRRDAELHLVRVKEKITSLETSISETRDSIREFRTRLEAARTQSEGRAEPEELAGADLAQLEEHVLGLEREKESAAESAGRLRLEKVALSGELETVEMRIRNFEKLETELQQLVQARREDLGRCREQIGLSEEDIERSRGEIAGMHERKESAEKDIDSTREQYDALRATHDELEKEVRQMKDQRDAKRENLERVSVELATLEERVSGVVDKARENFGQDLAAYLNGTASFDTSEWETFDRAELDDVKEKLASFGPVNMLAMDEYEEKKERFDFLSQQKQDLDEARDSLVQAIRRINREARRLLGETFEQVRENFQQTFITLFDGGEADLLFDSEDPLEANIKIVASPRGKRLHDVSVLSSGEKALVALSFLFGIYLVKPSPFCVFDEVDAPLDDANIARYVRLLKSFTDRTQFIVITHNKKTMEAADNLYGVTMEEPGVSKLISVHLDDAERFKHHGMTTRPESEAGAAAPA